jgi:hypothetical protein
MIAAAGPANAELEEIRRELARVRDRTRTVFADVPEDALNRRPSEKSWSAAECALHLVEVNERYLEEMEEVIRRAREDGGAAPGPFRPSWFGRWFLRQVSPGNGRKMPTAKLFEPRRLDPGRDAVDRLEATLDRLERAIRDSEGLDLGAVKVTSPALRLLKFQLGVALRMLVLHTERHVNQAERALGSGSSRTGT